MRRGQSAVMDALIFIVIASSAASLIVYSSAAYSSTTYSQVTSMYAQEFVSSAMVALHYVKDSEGRMFWNELSGRLSKTEEAQTRVGKYLGTGGGKTIWETLRGKSPTKNVTLCFREPGSVSEGMYSFCYHEMGAESSDNARIGWREKCPTIYSETVYAVSASGSWQLSLNLCY